MSWIPTVDPDEATGPLRRLYDQAIGRAGKVYQILRLMSPNPEVLRASMALYRAVMFGESGLSRVQREMLATVVSRANRCRY
jgi:uncharacterized peroxidase-related enzyme